MHPPIRRTPAIDPIIHRRTTGSNMLVIA